VRASEIFEIFLPRLMYRARAFLAEEEEETKRTIWSHQFCSKGKARKKRSLSLSGRGV
jgi:hypothetical protein